MTSKQSQTLITIFIATVWLVNGLFCKILNYVPRHEEIVGAILSLDRPSAYFITKIIGFSEILMAIWVLTGIKARWNAVAQIIIIATMNLLEFVLVPDLLLWGSFNSIFAFIFIFIIYYNTFIVAKKTRIP
ncbi:DoxX-like family protein [Flavobacterium sp.]